MIDRAWAERFADDWIAAWNSYDLNAILSHYAEDVVFHSPRNWTKALQGKDLRFHLERVYVGSDSLSISYRNHRAQHVVETFVFNADGLVNKSIATYA
jgi:tagatose-1,6-bisphosphate aldolase non-catalytic subunit AgaZ/GatZ